MGHVPMAPDVAVCFAGWLNVNIPGNGASARANLVDALAADAFLAATYKPPGWPERPPRADCRPRRRRAASAVSHEAQCLLDQVEGLKPFAGFRIDRMLTREQLLARVREQPQWDNISRQFDIRKTTYGITMWAPVLGSEHLSVLREQHDLSRVMDLLEAHERARGARYRRVVWSRLEYDWLAPHPPLRVLDEGWVWTPPDSSMSDRHAVLDRAAADVWFRRWELILSRELLAVLPMRVVLRGGPEHLLREILRKRGLRVLTFPPTMLLSCCLEKSQCFMSWSCVRARGVPTSSGTREVYGKYFHELKTVVPHARAVACAGAEFVRIPRHSRRKIYGLAVGSAVSLPVARDPSAVERAHQSGAPLRLLTPWVQLRAADAAVAHVAASRAAGPDEKHCPLGSGNATAPNAASAAFCSCDDDEVALCPKGGLRCPAQPRPPQDDAARLNGSYVVGGVVYSAKGHRLPQALQRRGLAEGGRRARRQQREVRSSNSASRFI